jgi:hypothetical protein
MACAPPSRRPARWPRRCSQRYVRLIKIGARVIEHTARIRIHLPSSCPERSLFRTVRSLSCRAAHEQWGRGPDQPPTEAHQFRARCTASGNTPIQPIGLLPLARSTYVQKRGASCIFAAKIPNHRRRRLLRRRSQWPRRHATQPRDELPPSHQRSPTAGTTAYRSRGRMSGLDADLFCSAAGRSWP